MGEYVLKIEKLENGFEVEIMDAKIKAENDKPSKKGQMKPYVSPWKSYAFTTGKEAVAFVQKHIASLPKSSEDEFNDAAVEAFKD
jgi:hypothetical protein